MTNRTPRPRRGFSVCYVDAATRGRTDAARSWPQIFPQYLGEGDWIDNQYIGASSGDETGRAGGAKKVARL